MKQPSRIPFRWVLPIAQFILCAILLWPFRDGFISQIHSALHGYWPELVDKEEIVIHPGAPNHVNENVTQYYGDWRLVAPALLNMPVVLTGLTRRETVPMGIVSEWWRALTWPIVGLVFWWIVGRGMEALLAIRAHLISPAVSWAETIVAGLVSICMLVIVAALAVDPSMRSESIYPWRLASLACSVWFILGLTTVGARILQSRMRMGVPSKSATPAA